MIHHRSRSLAYLLLTTLANHVLGWTTTHVYHSRRELISSAIATAGVSLLPLSSLAAPPKPKPTDAVCDQAVTILSKKGRLLYILGTAHISEVSANLASQLIKDVKPDAVFIELDLKRVGGLPFNKIQRKVDRIEIPGPSGSNVIVPNIIPVSKTIAMSPAQQQATLASLFDSVDLGMSPEHNQVLASVLFGRGPNPGAGISAMYGNLSKQGFKPGEEFVVAVKEGQNIGADIILGDQDMGVTMQVC